MFKWQSTSNVRINGLNDKEPQKCTYRGTRECGGNLEECDEERGTVHDLVVETANETADKRRGPQDEKETKGQFTFAQFKEFVDGSGDENGAERQTDQIAKTRRCQN